MNLIDTHAHLADHQLIGQLPELLARAKAVGVQSMIVVGTTVQSSNQCIELAQQHDCLFASAGIHPNYCHQVLEGDWEHIVAMVQEPRVVAIGETGLDRYWKECPWEIQLDYFARHWELSRQTRLPVIVHMRSCDAEIVESIRIASQLGPTQGVMHSFTGAWEIARQCLDLGLYISFAGMLTYKNAEEIRAVAVKIPADRMLIETDSPYLSPEPKRRQRPNEPSHLIHTAECLATLRGIHLHELAEITTANARRLFKID